MPITSKTNINDKSSYYFPNLNNVISEPNHQPLKELSSVSEVARFKSPTTRFIDNHSQIAINRVLMRHGATAKEMDLFASIISQEREGFLGYQAGSSTVRLFQDFLTTIVKEILQIPIPDDFIFLRVPGDTTFCYEKVSDFLQKKGSPQLPLGWDTQPDIRQHIVSMNMNLYQSYDADWDLTPRYYLENTTWTHANVRDIIKPFCASLGIDSQTVDSIWPQALDLLSHKRGYILQFFDENKKYEFACEHSYIAHSGGAPHPAHKDHDILFDPSASNFPQIRLVMSNRSTLNPFSQIKMKRYDDMSMGERMNYESKLSSLLTNLPFDAKKTASVREKLLNLWGVKEELNEHSITKMINPSPLFSLTSQKRLRRKDRTTEVAMLKKSLLNLLKKEQPFYQIQVNSRPGNLTPIFVTIADVSHLALTEENLSEIFRLANQHTINKPYPLGDSPMKIGDLIAYRPNHNGTHSARQAAYFDALFAFVRSHGDKDKIDICNNLTDTEIMNLRLGAYFLRAGRVDESKLRDPPADEFRIRSALIYEQYAKQLKVPAETIDWIKMLIINSCKPDGIRDHDININGKNKLGFSLFSMAHELDLIRCYNANQMKDPLANVKKHLDYCFSDNQHHVNKESYIKQLLEYGKDLCQITGSHRAYDDHPGDQNQFMACSLNGDYCWQAAKSIPIPMNLSFIL